VTKAKQKAYKFGIYAEKIAVIFLRLKGYRVVAERYRNPKGEIDLLAVRGNTLAVIEVKARKTFFSGAESITPWKQQKIIGALEWLLAGRGKIAGLGSMGERNIRFDVMLIVPWRWPVHMKDAWRM